MRPSNPDKQTTRLARIEMFESRLMMTANPVSELEPAIVELVAAEQIEIAPTLAAANAATGVDYVHKDYGFQGAGQTIAVIDSGIAWDHYALGGGFGADYRVVGGWDFAENDANPYDDGPIGFHGSHVAGIIGSSDAVNTGVASAADLVALRVFDDYGKGSFDMVEQALQWVHDHRNDFENPITTVNLSLGTTWNSNKIPDWATLENEFAQLEKDGIFIAVAAGNSFKSYGTKGLSYPAASEYVVPVASHDANGNMSDFSQRNERVLVAPGENITSTVPEHVVGGRGTAKSFYTASGTSMAAPYVAGASALLREAMEFMGQKNISQDTLYDEFRKTADRVYDSVTKTTYFSINLGNAIDDVVSDFHGNTINSATDLGVLSGQQKMSGTIGKLSDLDYFTFTASASGTVSFTIDTTHQLEADIGLVGGNLSKQGNTYSFDVQAGKNYTLHMGTSDGIGHYEIDLKMTEAFSLRAHDWGAVSAKSISGMQVSGESWYQFNAARNGTVTVEWLNETQQNDLQYEIYDSKLRLIDSNTSGNEQRIDFKGRQGETYFVCFRGQNNDVDVRITNLIDSQQENVAIFGTDQADDIRVDVQDQVHVSVNGVEYSFAKDQVNTLTIRGGGGNDSIRVNGSDQAESVVVSGSSFEMRGNGLRINGRSTESIHIIGGGGNDRAVMNDTLGDDTLTAQSAWTRMSSVNYSNTLEDFAQVTVNASSGNDVAQLYDSAGDDLLIASGDQVRLIGADQFYSLKGFDQVDAIASSGFDRAVFRDTAGNDHFVGNSTQSSMAGNDYRTTATGFDRAVAIAGNGGIDSADLLGTDGQDFVVARQNNAIVRNALTFNLARGFANVSINTLAGQDSGNFFMPDKSSLLDVNQDQISLSSAATKLRVSGLNVVNVTGGNGVDTAVFSQIGKLDELIGKGSLAQVKYEDLAVRVFEFEQVTARAKTGETAHAELNAIDFLFSAEGDWE